MTNPLRAKLEITTKDIWGSLSEIPGVAIWNIFGTGKKAPKIGAGNWFDTTAFYATTNVHVGEDYNYVFNDSKLLAKPAKFFRYTAGVKIKEEEMEGLDDDELWALVESRATKQERGLRAKAAYEGLGYAADVAGTGFGWGVLRLGAASSPTVIDPYDCQGTSGTVENLGTVNFTGAGKTALNINTTIGAAQRAIGAAVLDATTGESILRNDGSDTFDLWMHPRMYNILKTNKDLLIAAVQEAKLTYLKELGQDWDTTCRATMALGACTGVADATSVIILTANTKENFYVVPVVEPHWMPWKDIDNGNKIFFVKRYKAGLGFLAKVFIDSAGDPYKAMYAMSITPNGA